MTAIAVTGRPLVISAADHPVDLIPAAARRSRVAGWPVVRDHQGAVGSEGEAEWIAQADRPDWVARAERVVARNRAIGVVAQNLAADARRVLRLGRHVVLAQGDVQLAVGAERDPPALVAAVGPGRQVLDDGRYVGARSTTVQPAHDPLAREVVGAAVEGIDEVIFVEGRAQRQAKPAAGRYQGGCPALCAKSLRPSPRTPAPAWLPSHATTGPARVPSACITHAPPAAPRIVVKRTWEPSGDQPPK